MTYIAPGHSADSDPYHRTVAEEIELVRTNRGTGLILSGRGLKHFPSEICSLTWLEQLDITKNSIPSLPKEVSALKNLDALYAESNRITSLPDEIVEMGSLRYVTLDSNLIESLPTGMNALQQLTTFRIAGNRITTLPADLSEMTYRCLSGLSTNPIDDSLRVIIDAGPPAVIAYLQSLASGEEQYEAKVVFIGEGEVGKSSLLASLLGTQFIEGRSTTHGIEIATLMLPHPTVAEQNIRLNCWDFGGQEVYRITHQFFYSRRSLYLVVWNTRQGHEANDVEGWLTRLRLRIGDDARILIVATHADERRAEIDFETIRRSNPDVLSGHYEIDSKTKRGVSELRLAISKEAALLPQMGSALSAHWARVREELAGLSVAYVAYGRYLEICSAHGLGGAEATALSALLHDLGVIIHYADDDGLRDLVVLQPEWLTKAIGYVLEDERTRSQGGVLEHERLRDIWGSSSGLNYPYELYPYFLRLMEKFDVSYRLSEQDASLIGQLVPHIRPTLTDSHRTMGRSSDGANSRTLALRCKMKEEAPGLIAWVTVRNHRFSTGRHWRRGVELLYQQYQSYALIELVDSRTVELTVSGPSPDFFFNILRDGLEDLLSRRWPGLEFDFLLPCRESENCSGYFPMRTVLRHREKERERIDCPECLVSHSVTELLTGFAPPEPSDLALLQDIRRGQIELRGDVLRLESYAAQAADQTRALLRAASTEITDCPRLFTLSAREARFGRLKDRQVLTLWCEARGQEHSVAGDPYLIDDWRAWVRKISPYLTLATKILALFVPLATTGISDIVSTSDADLINRHLEAVKDVLGEVQLEATQHIETGPTGGLRLRAADSVALRGFREMLFSIDPARHFGGLRRVTTPEGDMLWVCDEHALAYDPGLPTL